MHTRTYPQGHRLRLGRYSEAGRIYLVTAVVRNREPVMARWDAGRTCARILHRVPNDAPVTSIAWVVMPDHVHWLFRLETGTLPVVLCHFKSRAAREINRVSGRSGTFWQAGYHDRAVRRDEDVRGLARYVVANPLRAGLCQSVAEYPFWNAIWLDGDPGNFVDP